MTFTFLPHRLKQAQDITTITEETENKTFDWILQQFSNRDPHNLKWCYPSQYSHAYSYITQLPTSITHTVNYYTIFEKLHWLLHYGLEVMFPFSV